MKFTIIIPTRERVDTLYWTLKTCLMQDYEDLTILVSDNLSQDNTEEVVRSFNDSRIQYIKTPKRLSMSRNWDFALSHVKDGFVTILGDDDGLLKEGVSQAASLIKDHNLLVLNQNSDSYCWPNHLGEEQRNTLVISLKDEFEMLDTRRELKNTLSSPMNYMKLPWLYRGFVHIDLINEIKRVTASQHFFRSMIPDVYSGIAISNLVKEYGYSHKPLALNGASGHSGGTSLFNPDKANKSFDKFLSETDIEFHPKLSNCPSIGVLLAESIYQAIDAGITLDVNLNLENILEFAIEDYRNAERIKKEKILFALVEIGEKNGMSDFISRKLKEADGPIIQKKKQTITKGYNFITKRVTIRANDFNALNVYEAALLHHKILTEKPSSVFSAYNILKTIIKTVSKKGIRGTVGRLVGAHNSN